MWGDVTQDQPGDGLCEAMVPKVVLHMFHLLFGLGYWRSHLFGLIVHAILGQFAGTFAVVLRRLYNTIIDRTNLSRIYVG